MTQAPHYCRPDRSAGLQNPRIADCQLNPEIRTKRVDVRRIVVKREQHDAGSIDFRNSRHDSSALCWNSPDLRPNSTAVVCAMPASNALKRSIRNMRNWCSFGKPSSGTALKPDAPRSAGALGRRTHAKSPK